MPMIVPLAPAQTTRSGADRSEDTYHEYEIAEDAPPQKVEVTFTAADIPCLLLMAALFLAFVGTIFYLMYSRTRGHIAELDAADELFARSVLKESDAPVTDPPTTDLPAPDSTTPDEETRPIYGDTAPWPTAAPARDATPKPRIEPPPVTLPENDTLAMAVDHLKRLGVIGDREGQLPLAIPPAAPIHRLRRISGVAVILPRYESEALVEHCLRRFDLVIVVASDGAVVALSRIEDRLTELGNLPKSL